MKSVIEIIQLYDKDITRFLNYSPEKFMREKAKYIHHRLDDLCSLTVRIRDDFTCKLCGKAYPEIVPQCGHVIERDCWPTRWYEGNLFCQCAGENYDQENHPTKYRLKWTEILGGPEAYDLLVRKAFTPGKISKVQKADLLQHWQSRLREELARRGYEKYIQR
jgi:hypothetical protein